MQREAGLLLCRAEASVQMITREVRVASNDCRTCNVPEEVISRVFRNAQKERCVGCDQNSQPRGRAVAFAQQSLIRNLPVGHGLLDDFEQSIFVRSATARRPST